MVRSGFLCESYPYWELDTFRSLQYNLKGPGTLLVPGPLSFLTKIFSCMHKVHPEGIHAEDNKVFIRSENEQKETHHV